MIRFKGVAVPNIYQVVPYLCATLPVDLLPELEVLVDMEDGGPDEVTVAGLSIRCPGGESNGWSVHVLEEDGSLPLVAWAWDAAEAAASAARIVCDWRRVQDLEDLRALQDRLLASVAP